VTKDSLRKKKRGKRREREKIKKPARFGQIAIAIAIALHPTIYEYTIANAYDKLACTKSTHNASLPPRHLYLTRALTYFYQFAFHTIINSR
jgi:hypothetical protein